MVIFFLFLNILCRRDGSRACLVCCHFSFDVASIHEMPSISFHLNLETLKLHLSQSSCSQFFLLLSRERKFGSFHVVVLQIYAKKFAKIFYPRAQPLFCLLNVFVSCRSRRRRCRCRGFLKLPIQKCALFFFCYWSFPGPFVPSRLSCFAPLLKSMFSMLSMLNVRLICYVT